MVKKTNLTKRQEEIKEIMGYNIDETQKMALERFANYGNNISDEDQNIINDMVYNLEDYAVNKIKSIVEQSKPKIKAEEKTKTGTRKKGLKAVLDAFYKGEPASEIERFSIQKGGLFAGKGGKSSEIKTNRTPTRNGVNIIFIISLLKRIT